MEYLDFVVLVVPAFIGLVATLFRGPSQGTLTGGVVMLVTVFVLLLFQITIPHTGPGAEISRASYAWGLFAFEWYRWLPAFLVGAAVGSVVFRMRHRSARVS